MTEITTIDDIMHPGERTRKNVEAQRALGAHAFKLQRADLDCQLATLARMQELGLELNPGDTHEDLVARVEQAEELDRQAVDASGTDMTDEEMIARAALDAGVTERAAPGDQLSDS